MNGKQARTLRGLARMKTVGASPEVTRKMYRILKRWFARKELRV